MTRKQFICGLLIFVFGAILGHVSKSTSPANVEIVNTGDWKDDIIVQGVGKGARLDLYLTTTRIVVRGKPIQILPVDVDRTGGHPFIIRLPNGIEIYAISSPQSNFTQLQQ